MKCHDCGQADLEPCRKNHRYIECGLDHVVLMNVVVEQCPHCGMEYVDIPSMSQLHRAIAVHLVLKPEALTPAEIRFLRKSLGWSGDDFAAFMHASPATIQRWENFDQPKPMGQQAELVLRLAVAHDFKIEDYGLEKVSKLPLNRQTTPAHLKMSRSGEKWVDTAA